MNLPCGHMMSHKKFGPDWFSRFDVYWIHTDKSNLYIDWLNFDYLEKIL